MERECRVCGRTYRGLVCQHCHPRGKNKKRQADSVQTWTATMTPAPHFGEQTTTQPDQVQDGQG